MFLRQLKSQLNKPAGDARYRNLWQRLHIDLALFILVLLLALAGLTILYSAASENIAMVESQIGHLVFAFVLMIAVAQISPISLQRIGPWLYAIGLLLLFVVLVMGHISKGAQRWVGLGSIHFQPAELMKLAIPLLLAWLCQKESLPIKFTIVILAIPIIFIPAVLTAKQPDLGTAILLVTSGFIVLFLAGLSIRLIIYGLLAIAACIPLLWHVMHAYQKERILTFLNPESNPLGKGYHIIQSKIAIGSGGIFGKGWLHGTQSHLHFLPEHTTDFIFAVCGEELGLVGAVILILLYLFVFFRALYITLNAQDTFSRLLAGSITFNFFISFFINMGMVTGMLPVVGVPLPLVSYGGSSMMTLLASFGMLMAIQTHRRLVTE